MNGELGDRLSGLATLEHDSAEAAAQVYTATSAPPAGDDWWQHAYKGGPPVGPADLIRPLYFPGNPSHKPPSVDGPDVVAVKRAVWRGGRWQGPASRFDDTYSRMFALGVGGNVIDTGLAGFQRQQRIQATGQLGNATYQAMRYARVPDALPHAGEPLFDDYAVSLLEQAATGAASLDLDETRETIARYLRDCISHEPVWHYEQIRPMTHLGRTPAQGGYCDCSSHATGAYYWAGAPDPNHRGYDGYGYTGTLIANPETKPPYKVGDLALYGPSTDQTSHVVTCYQPGDQASSRWCSHGSEAAPYSVELRYRTDLLLVVRPPLA